MKLEDIHGIGLDALAARAYGLPAEEIMLDEGWQACLVYLPTLERGENLGIDTDELILGEFRAFGPTSNWAQAGLLSDLEDISVDRVGGKVPGSTGPYAYMPGSELAGQYGKTATGAITRCFIASKLGVDIPDEWIPKLIGSAIES